MMWTLNARRSIRVGGSSGNMTSSGEITGRSRRVRTSFLSKLKTFLTYHRHAQREDVELGRFGTVGTIHIRTEIETDHYLEVYLIRCDSLPLLQ